MKILPIKKTKTYFYSLLTKTISIVLLIVLGISLFLYFNFRNFTLDYINKSNLNILQQVSNNTLQINNYATTFTSSLFNNSYCQQLMYGSDSDVVENLKSIRLLENLMSNTPFVHSISIYNKSLDTFYFIGPETITRKKENFFDKELVEMLDNYKYIEPAPIPRRIAPYPLSDKKDDVLSYTIVEKFLDSGKVKNALIVNINVNWIFNSIKSNTSFEIPGNIFLLNPNGKVIAHSDSNMFMKTLGSEEYVKKILNSSNTSGFFTNLIGTEKSLVNYVYMQSPQWILVNTMPYNYIASSVNKVRTITFFISFLVLLLGILMSIITSKHLYSPVNLLINKTFSLNKKNIQSPFEKNEFEYISTLMSSTAEELDRLNYFKSKNINILKQQFLRSLLSNISEPLEGISQKCSELNLNVTLPCDIFLVIIKIDNYSNFVNMNSKTDQTLKFALINIADELLCQHLRCECIDTENDHIVVIVHAEGKDDLSAFQEISPLLSELGNVLSHYYKITISSFVSNICRNIIEIPHIYRDTIHISDYRLVYGHRCILSQQEIEKLEFEFYDISSWNIEALIDSLKLGNLEKVQLSFENLYNKLYKCSYDDIIIAISYISSMVFNAIGIIEKNSNFSIKTSYSSFKTIINKLETLDQIKEEFLALFSEVISKLNLCKDTKNEIIIKKIIDYIDVNYSSPVICSSTISEMFNLSSPYLSKMLREATSRSLPDYINNIRIKKACALLSDSDLSLDEILRKIGWDNKNYFFTIFKKSTGVTPTEYRLKQNIRKIDSL